MTANPAIDEEGEIFSIDAQERWHCLAPRRGDVLLAEVGPFNWEVAETITVPFLVLNVVVTDEGGLTIQSRSLGSSNEAASKKLSNQFNRKLGYLHLCPFWPCTQPEHGNIHVTKLAWFSFEGYAPQLSTATLKQARKWLGIAPEVEETAPSALPPPGGDYPGGEPLPGLGVPDAPGKELEEKTKGKKPSGDRTGEVDPAKVEALRKRLNVAREKIANGGGGPPDPGPPEGSGDDSSETSGTSSSTSSESAAREKEIAHADGLLGDAAQASLQPPKAAKGDSTAALKDQKSHPAGVGALGAGTGLALGSTRSAEGVQEALVQAVQRAADSQKKKKKKKRKAKKGSQGSSSSSKKKKKKAKATSAATKKKKTKKAKKKATAKGTKKAKKKKKKKKKASSSSGSSQTSSQDDDLELEAPLKRRSQENPGSVLQMLLQHVRTQLQQEAQVDVSTSSADVVTSGIRLQTYWALHIKPSFSQAQRELREMHLLALSVDLLRQGLLARLGDVLAGRFCAIHQSLIDASWAGAKYLEVAPMGDGSALRDSILLEARKHSKQIMRTQGVDYSWPKGRGKGNRGGGWQSWQGDGDYGKGSKAGGKGKKGLRKGKGQKGGENQPKTDWKETQDKAA